MTTYGGYIERLSRKVEARLSDIEAVFNFDLGSEFEVAMCLLLQDILPNRYGVCRGFVVSEAGERAGDDVIIYDKMACPTLRATDGLTYAIKEQIPVDAVYAYLECKHSISDESIFNKAIEQVRTVKSLLMTRTPKRNLEYEDGGPVYNGKVRDWPRPYPCLKNQPFCMIVARKSKGKIPGTIVQDQYTPDLLILGSDHIATQSVLLGPDGIKGALFYDDRYWSGLRVEAVSGNAFGLGLVCLMQALSWIELERLDWTHSLNAAFAEALFKKS